VARFSRWLVGTGAAAALVACRPEASPDRTATPTSSPEAPAAVPSTTVGSPGTPGPTPTFVAQRAAAPMDGPRRYAFDFEDADLPELVRFIGNITGKRFILTGKLPAVHATVHSPEPVTADEAYGAFLSILQANGLTVVRSGDFWNILPSPGVPPMPAGH
jgi:general secretion pathway protein D